MLPGVVRCARATHLLVRPFRNSPTFAAFDVPLLGPVLDNALQVADAFRDKVLIDDNDNGLDDSKTLLFDLNAALAEAGLEDKLFAANLGASSP